MTTPRTHEGRVLPKQDEELVDQGLQFDLGTLVGRRRMLGLIGAGTVLGLTACASGSDSSSGGSGSATTSSGSSLTLARRRPSVWGMSSRKRRGPTEATGMSHSGLCPAQAPGSVAALASSSSVNRWAARCWT